jgi:hypothetical protein
VLDRYLVWRVRKQVLVFILDQLTPWDAKIFKDLPPALTWKILILVTASVNLTQQKKRKYKCQRTGWFELPTRNLDDELTAKTKLKTDQLSFLLN